MTNQLAIGVLGTGFAGMHIQRLLRLKDVAVRAVCGTSEAKAQACIERLGAHEAQAFGDFETMLDTVKLDALYVCIPPHAHHGQVEQAAARGIHLFLEKPIAFDIAGAERQAEAIERAGVTSLVGYHNRFRESVEAFKHLVDTGAAGRATLFQGRYWCNMTGPTWWRSAQGARAQVFEQVIHIYDMALHLLGEPESVCAFTDNLVHRHIPDYTIEDTSAAIIRFKNGALASIVGSNAAIPQRYLGDFRVVCAKAALDYRSVGQDTVTPPQATLHDYSGEAVNTREFIETRDPYLAETQEFLAAIRGEIAPRAPVQDGVLGVRLVSAVLESAARNGQPISI